MTVVVKTTFVLQPGACELADHQEPLATSEVAYERDRQRGLRAPSDFAPFKARADVLVVGSAFASGEPGRSVTIRVAIGGVDKSMELSLDGRASVPLTGLGPISTAWPNRRALTRDVGDVTRERFEQEPIATRVDRAYFNDAPPDQQREFFMPGERLILENLNPELPRLVTALPTVALRAFAEGAATPIPLVADTLLIDTDRQICTLTWRGQHDLLGSERARIIVEPATSQPSDRGPSSAPTMLPHLARSKASTLPFMRSAGQPARDSMPFTGYQPPAPRPAEPTAMPPIAQAPAMVAAPSRPPMAVMAPSQPPMGVALPPIAVSAPSHAPVVGTVAASNAAADAPPLVKAPISEKRQTRSIAPVDLVWCEKAAGRRMRIWWKALLTESDFDEFDSKHELASDDAEHDRARLDAFAVLTRETPISPAEVRAALEEAIDDHGRFTPPLAVIEGDLRMLYGEIPRLEAMLTLVSPLAASDKRLLELTEMGVQAAKLQGPGAALQAARASARIREHVQQTYSKGPGSIQIDAEVDRALSDARAYDERTLFGAKHLRAVLGTGPDAIPVYVPASARDMLPLLDGFSARLIAEVHVRQDRSESHALSLRALAVGRHLTLDPTRRG
ncbi:MAG: DUF2169 domain-containing protein [Polyangiaceae bacterium]|nr:DUF2169 domain-containing protein [Polyangiaceae bacterium]